MASQTGPKISADIVRRYRYDYPTAIDFEPR